MAAKPTKYTLWGTDVTLEINKDVFPNEDELKKMDEKLNHPIHGYFETSHGAKLHYKKNLPPEGRKPKAICIYQHGIQGHGGQCAVVEDGDKAPKYTNSGLLSRKMVENDIAFYTLDMLGHGFSEGHRFYIPDGQWQINRNDLEEFAKFVIKEFHDDETPLFLFGDSYGACLSIHVSRMWQDDPEKKPKSFKGFVLSAPAIIGDLPPYIVVLILRYCFAPIAPTWTPFFMPHPVTAERIWSNETVRAEYKTGRDQEIGLMRSSPFSLGTAVGLLTALEAVREQAIPGLSIPYCVVHGTDDFAVPIAGTDYLLEHSITPEEDRAVRKVEGGFHDLMAEPANNEETAMFVIDWMKSRLSKD